MYNPPFTNVIKIRNGNKISYMRKGSINIHCTIKKLI